jgi:predicted acetyltransferase
LCKCSREEFISAISTDPADKFAKTFVAKADMQKQWDECWGVFEGTQLMAAIITTVSKRKPHVANLQLLHTFANHRGKGAARVLCENSLSDMKNRGVSFFRVSSEPSAVGFYEKIGFKFWGKQKSGCQLSIFRITSDSFSECEYDYTDSVIYNAVNKKGKGGCVEIFDTASVNKIASLTQF